MRAWETASWYGLGITVGYGLAWYDGASWGGLFGCLLGAVFVGFFVSWREAKRDAATH